MQKVRCYSNWRAISENSHTVKWEHLGFEEELQEFRRSTPGEELRHHQKEYDPFVKKNILFR